MKTILQINLRGKQKLWTVIAMLSFIVSLVANDSTGYSGSHARHLLNAPKEKFLINPTDNLFGLGDLEANVTTPWVQPTFQVSATSSRIPNSNGILPCTALTCPTISGVNNTTDSDIANYATIQFPVLGIFAEANIRVTETDEDYASGAFVGFAVEKVGGLLGLDLFNNIAIRTYLNGVQQESYFAADLLTLSLIESGSPGVFEVGFWTTLGFDAVEFHIAQPVGLSLGGEIRVYHALLEKAEAGLSPVCNAGTGTTWTKPNYPVRINLDETGLTGACVGCSMSGEINLIDEDTTNFAHISVLAGLTGGAQIAIHDPITTGYDAGSFVGFTVEDQTGLLDLTLLEAITIETYLDGSIQNTATVGSLINLDLVSGKQLVGFHTDLPFDEVRIKVQSLLSLLIDIHVFQTIIAPAGCILIDSDGDSITDNIEDAAPNTGDGNFDGIPDKIQGSVASLPSVYGDYVTLEAEGLCEQITAIWSVEETDLLQQTEAYLFPYGLINFELQCSILGGTANVTYYWHATNVLDDYIFVKEGPLVPGENDRFFYPFTAIFADTDTLGNNGIATTTVFLTDGLLGDDSGLDGLIVDPAGPALPKPAPGGVLADLSLWYKADDTAFQSFASGDPVLIWNDLSDNNNHATTSPINAMFWDNTNLAPLEWKNGADTMAINFNPVVYVDSNYLDGILPLGLSTHEIFAVVRPDNGKNLQILGWDAMQQPRTASDENFSSIMSTAATTITNIAGDKAATASESFLRATYDLPTTSYANDYGVLTYFRHTGSNDFDADFNGQQIFLGGYPDYSETIGTNAINIIPYNANFRIGGTPNGDVGQGAIAEIINYGAGLTSTQREAVQSYLAIKYGITLQHNYTVSDGTIIYTLGQGFDQNIAGIGRDNNFSCIHQKQSKSSDAGAILTIGLNEIAASNQLNTNGFDTDLSFLLWGHNGNSGVWTVTAAPTDFQILDRQWRITETGNVAAVKLQFDVDNPEFDIPDPISGSTYYIIYDTDNDNDLSDEAPLALVNSSAGIWESIANIDFADGMKFTLATAIIDADNDGFTGINDPDDSDPCVPDNTNTNCCEAIAPIIDNN